MWHHLLTQTRKLTLWQNVPFMFIFFHSFDTTSDSRYSLKKLVITPIMFSVSFKLICYICLIMIELIRLVYLVLCPCGRCAHLCVLICARVCVCALFSPNSEPTVRDAFQPGNHHLLSELRARQSCTFRWEGRLVLLRNPQLHFQQWDEPGLQLHG